MDNETLVIALINQHFLLTKKLDELPGSGASARPVRRMRELLEEDGFVWLDPTGEPYSESRTDMEASLSGEGQGPYTIVEVLKPVIYRKEGDQTRLLQKGVVIAE